MASPTVTTGLTAFIPNYWDTVLGENLYPNLYLYQFGTKRQVPRNFGTTIKIPRLKKQNIVASLANVPGSGEGTIIGTCPLSSEFISGTLKQFAGAYKHSDIVIMTALSDVIELSLRDIARDIAKRMDTHVRDQLSGGGQFVGGSGNTSDGGVATADVVRASDLLKGAVLLDDFDNPRPPDGHYPFVTAPKAIFDLQANLSGNGWLEINKQASDNTVGHIYRGEVGRLFGTRVVTTTNTAKVLAVNEMSAGTSGYRSFMFAPDSYYVTEISDMTAKTFVKQLGSAGTADPVNQVATVGAKVFFTAILAEWNTANERRYVRLAHGASLF